MEWGIFMTFYNSSGRAVAYLHDDGEHIYLFSGQPVAYLSNDAVYAFNGTQLGWFENGWIRDLTGKCVFFTETSTGSGPIKPVKHVKPVKGVKHVRPLKCVKHARHAKAAKSLSWSQLSGEQFFVQ